MARVALLLFAVAMPIAPAAADPARRFVFVDGGKLRYDADVRGNRIPDFSHAGYGGGKPLAAVEVKAFVPALPGDAGPRIQAAIDFVSTLPTDADGFRGAVLLGDGRHELAGQLRLTTSGVVLRGQGPNTVLRATGIERRAVVRVRGTAQTMVGEVRPIAAEYVPVGAADVRLVSTAGIRVGDRIEISRPSTKEWVAAVGMDRFPSRDKGSYLDWKPGTVDLRWDRTVTKIVGETITFDAPLTSALDRSHGGCMVRKLNRSGRIQRVGIENLRIESTFDATNRHDEDHAWTGVTVEDAEDVWVRRVSFRHLAGSAVAVWESARRVTVVDCDSAEPVSELGGFRRQTFFTAGQQTLFVRCTAADGRHDFAVGHLATGPTAFVHCRSTNAHGFSGPIGSWASGVLFDNVHIDGGELVLTNRETDDAGTGWAAANSVLWQCSAPKVVCRMSPTGRNWAIGVWGQFVGDGHWRQLNEFAKPDSLFAAQLVERLGSDGVLKPATLPTEPGDARRFETGNPPVPALPQQKLAVTDGRLTVDGSLLTGKRLGTVWWRGSVLPSRAAELGVGVTRFVPGRDGAGYTDDLAELTDEMLANGIALLDHHWGLWYDRRRDDHQMLRRMDGDVWPPFYEQPWARSGKGTAWDGLSKYDLDRFNPWYFARLRAFADRAAERGRVLVQQMYFQHNILEAGAHWADFPWRPANCLQPTGFPEPPEYVGQKRVFMAEAFYDVSHPVRRELHRKYIRHCLDVLGDCPNVIFQTGEEFTGPLHFMRFWLDTIADWQRVTGKRVRIGLSATKDVQDAILADAERTELVSVIDMKYWWPTPDSKLYAPPGGENLAPRQQLREWKGPKGRADMTIAAAVREYRNRFPDKAVTVSLDGVSGWAVAAAGGSVPALPTGTPKALLKAFPRMRDAGTFALADPGRDYFTWSPTGGPVRIDLTGRSESFDAVWLDTKTGEPHAAGPVAGGRVVELRPHTTGPAVLWLTKR